MIPANVTSALASLSTAVSAAGTLQGASIPTLAPVLAAAAAAATAISTTMTALDPTLNAVSPDGSDPAVEASWLTTIAGDFVEQSSLADAYGYVDRIALNIELGAG